MAAADQQLVKLRGSSLLVGSHLVLHDVLYFVSYYSLSSTPRLPSDTYCPLVAGKRIPRRLARTPSAQSTREIVRGGGGGGHPLVTEGQHPSLLVVCENHSHFFAGSLKVLCPVNSLRVLL